MYYNRSTDKGILLKAMLSFKAKIFTYDMFIAMNTRKTVDF